LGSAKYPQDKPAVTAVICYQTASRRTHARARKFFAPTEPNEKLVKIFDTEQENEAIVVQGLLESAGIDCDLRSIDAVQSVYPGVGGTLLLVREEDAPKRRKLSKPTATCRLSTTRPPISPGERAVRRITATGDIPSERARRALHGAHSL